MINNSVIQKAMKEAAKKLTEELFKDINLDNKITLFLDLDNNSEVFLLDEDYVYSFDNFNFDTGYMIEIEEDWRVGCFSYSVYNYYPTYNVEASIELGFDVFTIEEKSKELLFKVWETEYDNRGVTTYNNHCMQEEIIFYIGNVSKFLKDFLLQLENS